MRKMYDITFPWTGHVTYEGSNKFRVLWENVMERNMLEDLGEDGRNLKPWYQN
jgi:hypothetical protein